MKKLLLLISVFLIGNSVFTQSQIEKVESHAKEVEKYHY